MSIFIFFFPIFESKVFGFSLSLSLPNCSCLGPSLIYCIVSYQLSHATHRLIFPLQYHPPFCDDASDSLKAFPWPQSHSLGPSIDWLTDPQHQQYINTSTHQRTRASPSRLRELSSLPHETFPSDHTQTP
ncbi:hypothetical protein BKA81DRAFT_98972 [Phyllosticta paracitricarpa]